MPRKFRVIVDPGAVLAFAAVICLFETDMLICLALSVLCHEAGHFFALGLFHVRVESLSVSATGLSANFARAELSYWAEALCVLAGPVFGTILAFAAASAGIYLLAGISLLLTLFNLIPAYPLDGGRLAELILSYIFGADAGDRAARYVGAVTSFLVFAAGIYMCYFMRAGLTLVFIGAWLIAEYCKIFDCSVK